MTHFAELVTSEQVKEIHAASLELLDTVGLLVRNENARAIFAKHGCRVDGATQIVTFPRAVVEQFRAAFPPTFTFYGRDPQYDRVVPRDRPVIVTGSSAPDLIDPVTGQVRRSYSDDIARIAHLINELPGYDVFSISTLAEDAPPGYHTIARLYPSLKNCLKPVRCNALNAEDAEKILRMGALVAGSDDAYRARPFITGHFCPVVAPLTMDVDSTEMLIYFTERQLPNYATIVPNGGMSSPLTLLGTLTQGNAEFLAWSTLTQMVRPETPLIYSSLSTLADMRRGNYAPGAIETGMLHMAHAQMARFYNVPSGGYIGLTNSKLNDAQAGYECGMSVVAGLLGGADMFNLGGLLDALTTFDFGKAVIDNEIALMLKRLQRGFEFSRENFSLDLIKQVGPGGMFMDKPETFDRMKTSLFLPEIADRNVRERWQKQGASDAQTRAMKRVREILTRDNPAVFSPEVDARVRAAFTGLVKGDSVPPPEWRK
ncbi:MAG: trimethylamine methyltransferase [Chloroflexi bacterium]|nr:trimethylamine methyltransferase [Chloroflexota bacterium]